MTLFIGFLLDLLFGDPESIPHPIRFIGSLISCSEKFIRKIFPNTKIWLLFGGMILCILVSSMCFIVPFLILYLLWLVNPILAIVVDCFFTFQILATNSLKKESMKVYYSLEKGDILQARKHLSYIVGRDTEDLDEEALSRGAIETIAENTCDGVIAPMFYISFFSSPLGFFYKGVNTLDSMVGYKNEKYLYLGRFSAKFDDVLNFIPARISSYIMILAAFILRLDYKNAWKIHKRDCKNHSSPNSGHTEAVCAGALNICLGGDSHYFGKKVSKQAIGDPNIIIDKNHIILANRLLYVTAIIGAIIFSVLKVILTMFVLRVV